MGRSCEAWSSNMWQADLTADVNVTARPAAGITGVMALPIHGAWKSLRRKMAGSPQNTLREPRTALSHQNASQVSKEEKDRIIQAFEEAAKGAAERRSKLRVQAEKLMEGDAAALDDTQPSTVVQTPKEESAASPSSEAVIDSAQSGGDGQKSDVEEAERRGYERAMEELRRDREKDQGSKGF